MVEARNAIRDLRMAIHYACCKGPTPYILASGRAGPDGLPTTLEVADGSASHPVKSPRNESYAGNLKKRMTL